MGLVVVTALQVRGKREGEGRLDWGDWAVSAVLLDWPSLVVLMVWWVYWLRFTCRALVVCGACWRQGYCAVF